MDMPKGLPPINKLLKRHQSAKSRYELWRSLHQEAMDYSMPQRETFTVNSEGQRKDKILFDSTAEEGAKQFASRIQGSLLPSWQQWMNLTAGGDIPEEQKEEANKLLKDATDTFFNHLNHSNFDTEITPSLLDLSVGTGAILVEENSFDENSALKFTCIPLAEMSIEKPARGAIKDVWRDQKVEAGNVQITWPSAELPKELDKLAKDKPETEVDIINGFLFNHKNKMYDQVVIWKKHLIFTQSFNKKRLIPFRWSVTPGEAYGRGPAIEKLPDIKTANKIVELRLGNGALQMSGVYTGRSDGMFNPHTARIAPGSIIPVMSNDNANPTIRDLTPSGNINITREDLEDSRNNIRKAFFSEPLGDISDPVRSATENVIRNQEFLKQSGAQIGRLKSELIEPLVAAGIEILQERGKIAELVIDGKDVTMKQTSPLAKAEDLEDFQNTQLWLSTMAQFVPQEILALKVKVEDLPAEFAGQLGVNPKLIRREAESKGVADKVTDAASAQLEQVQGAPNEQQV